jgi:colanic acid biosynthesis glycosyl transferase WcaI
MRLLVISNLFHPDRAGGAAVFSDLCFGLAEAGHDVTVYTSHPYYPEWRHKSVHRRWRIQREQIRGVEVIRHGLYLPSNPSSLPSRLLYEVSFAVSLLRSTFRHRDRDAVLVFCPLLGSVLFAAVRRVFLRQPIWLNVQDLPADAAAATGISRSRWFDRVAERAQYALFNRTDLWTTISPVMLHRLKASRYAKRDVRLRPNWLHASLDELVTGLRETRPLDESRPVELLYAGNIGMKQHLDAFCASLAEHHLPFRFRIHGEGSGARAVKAWVERSNDPRFTFGDFLDEGAFAQALSRTDFFVITERPGVGGSFVPSKLIPAISSGTPIFSVCDAVGPLGVETRDHGIGVQCGWDDLALGLRQIGALRRSVDAYEELRQRCLERAEIAYGRAAALDDAGRLLQHLVEGG